MSSFLKDLVCLFRAFGDKITKIFADRKNLWLTMRGLTFLLAFLLLAFCLFLVCIWDITMLKKELKAKVKTAYNPSSAALPINAALLVP